MMKCLHFGTVPLTISCTFSQRDSCIYAYVSVQCKVLEPANVDLHDAQAVLQNTHPCAVWSAWAGIHPEASRLKSSCITVYQRIRFVLQCPAKRKQPIKINPGRRRGRQTFWITVYPSLYWFPCPMSCAKRSTIGRETLLISIACVRKRDSNRESFFNFLFSFFLVSESHMTWLAGPFHFMCSRDEDCCTDICWCYWSKWVALSRQTELPFHCSVPLNILKPFFRPCLTWSTP